MVYYFYIPLESLCNIFHILYYFAKKQVLDNSVIFHFLQIQQNIISINDCQRQYFELKTENNFQHSPFNFKFKSKPFIEQLFQTKYSDISNQFIIYIIES